MSYQEYVTILDKNKKFIKQFYDYKNLFSADDNIPYNIFHNSNIKKEYNLNSSIIISGKDYLDYIYNLEYELTILHLRDMINLKKYFRLFYFCTPKGKYFKEEFHTDFLFDHSNDKYFKEIEELKYMLHNIIVNYNETKEFEKSSDYRKFIEYVEYYYEDLLDYINNYKITFNGNHDLALSKYYETNITIFKYCYNFPDIKIKIRLIY